MNSTDSLAGFTLWPGGECPVPPDTIVEYIVRGYFPVVEVVRRAHWLHWEHRRDGGDIIAYRVVAPERPPSPKPWDCQGDVPGPVCWLRRKGDARIEHGLVNSVYCFGLRAEGYGFLNWIALSEYEHSTDRKTWHPCVKP